MTAQGSRRRQSERAAAPARRWPAGLGISIGMLLLVGGGAAVYDYLSQPGRLPLHVVEINGEFQQLRPARIQETVVGAIDGGFFGCDMQKLRAAVLEIPWVEDVSIRRVWPDKLSMVVTEQVPLARWGDDGLINVTGGVFRPESLEGFNALVRLHGPAGSERRVVAFFQAAVRPARLRELQISEVELDARRHWWLRFTNGVTVSLGHENVDYRLAQFFRVYPSLLAEPSRRPERVDMRYAHGFAVRWQDSDAGETNGEAMKSQDKV